MHGLENEKWSKRVSPRRLSLSWTLRTIGWKKSPIITPYKHIRASHSPKCFLHLRPIGHVPAAQVKSQNAGGGSGFPMGHRRSQWMSPGGTSRGWTVTNGWKEKESANSSPLLYVRCFSSTYHRSRDISTGQMNGSSKAPAESLRDSCGQNNTAVACVCLPPLSSSLPPFAVLGLR